MNIVNKKGINTLIFRTVLEISMVVLFLIMSYFVFSTNNLAGSAQIAEAYSSSDYDFQTTFSRTSDNINDIMTFSNLLDKGELVVRNPNRIDKNVKVVLVIEGAENIEFDGLKIEFNDETVNLSNISYDGNTYEIELNEITIDAYANYRGVVALYNNNGNYENFNYSFRISEKL